MIESWRSSPPCDIAIEFYASCRMTIVILPLTDRAEVVYGACDNSSKMVFGKFGVASNLLTIKDGQRRIVPLMHPQTVMLSYPPSPTCDLCILSCPILKSPAASAELPAAAHLSAGMSWPDEHYQNTTLMVALFDSV
jgi:hypothetical protein